MALGALGLSREAIEQFRLALKIQPDYIPARYNLAKALARSGDFAEAAQDFSQVVAAFPQDAQVHNDFGELYLRMGKPSEALEQFEKALAINPAHSAALKEPRSGSWQQLHRGLIKGIGLDELAGMNPSECGQPTRKPQNLRVVIGLKSGESLLTHLSGKTKIAIYQNRERCFHETD